MVSLGNKKNYPELSSNSLSYHCVETDLMMDNNIFSAKNKKNHPRIIPKHSPYPMYSATRQGFLPL